MVALNNKVDEIIIIKEHVIVIFAEEMSKPEIFFTVTEYSPASASEQESISSVHLPFTHAAVIPFAFVSTGLLSFLQAASTGSANAFKVAVNSSGFPAAAVTRFSVVEKTGFSIEAIMKVEKVSSRDNVYFNSNENM